MTRTRTSQVHHKNVISDSVEYVDPKIYNDSGSAVAFDLVDEPLLTFVHFDCRCGPFPQMDTGDMDRPLHCRR